MKKIIFLILTALILDTRSFAGIIIEVTSSVNVKEELDKVDALIPSLEADALNCGFNADDVSKKTDLVNQINKTISEVADLYAEASAGNSKSDNKENTAPNEAIALTQKALDLNQKLIATAQTAEMCVFKTKLDTQIKDLGNDPNYKKFSSSLRSISNCMRSGNDSGNQKVKKSMMSVFEDMFDYFWNKKSELNDKDCEILKSSYSVWSSFYDDENDQLIKSDSKGTIPLYNVNDHNSSYYYWALEQNKGHVPPQGLTIFHADTHTDLHHVHDHSQGHWTSGVIGMNDIQKLMNNQDDSFKSAFINLVNSNQSLDPQVKIDKIKRINDTGVTQLRAELDGVVRKNVNHIAQPLAAAQLTGVNNGRFIMCMPPWSKELPRTTKDDPIIARFKEDRYGAYAHYLDSDQYRKWSRKNGGSINFPVDYNSEPVQSPTDAIQSKSQFYVIDCNNEDREVINPEVPADQQKYVTTQRKNQLPKIADFFTTEEEKNGFLLDLDLDAFVSEGHGDLVEPISYERPKSRGKPTEYADHGPAHGSHENASETNPNTEVPTIEYDLIKKRVDSFFSRLDELKKAGVSPKMITISDSTALARMMRGKKAGEHSGKWQAYTPDCLVFLLNFMARKRLKETYPEVVFPGQ